MVISRIKEAALFFVPIIQRQWVWIERTPHYFRVVIRSGQMRQVHIVEKARLDLSREQFLEHWSEPFRCARPIEFHSRLVIMRHGNAGPAVKNGLPNGGHSSGIMYVCTQVGTVIDPAEHPLGVRNNSEQPEPGTVRRRAMNCETLIATRFDTDAFPPGDGVTNPGLRPGWRHHHRIAYCADGAKQSLKAGSGDAIVVGEEELQ